MENRKMATKTTKADLEQEITALNQRLATCEASNDGLKAGLALIRETLHAASVTGRENKLSIKSDIELYMELKHPGFEYSAGMDDGTQDNPEIVRFLGHIYGKLMSEFE